MHSNSWLNSILLDKSSKELLCERINNYFNKNEFERIIGKVSFVQDNESRSSKGVLRGLHYQKPPFAQAKLIRCIEGEILDIAVDIRKDSPTYGLYHPEVLSGENKKQLFIPTGFAHGFVVLSETTEVAYKIDNTYSPKHEASIKFDDEILGLDWEIDAKDIILSKKDELAPNLGEAVIFENK